MRLLDRYLLRELLIGLAYCLGGLLIVVIAFDIIFGLNRIQEHQLLFKDVVELYLAKLPAILVFLIPITLLMALLYTLTNHARHNEITAMRAAGVSLWRVCLPYLTVGFVLSLVVFGLNEFLVPDSQARQEEIMDRRLGHNSAAANSVIQPTLGFPNARDGRTWVWDSYNFRTDVMTNPKVDWLENGSRWSLLARRAEYLNGAWKFYGSTVFSTNDIIGLDSLAAKLKQPTNSLEQFLSSQLSSKTQNLLGQYTNGTNADLKRALASDLNHIVRHGSLYEPQRFENIKLPPDVAKLAEKNLTGTDLVQLNRALLIESYPEELSRNSLYSVTVAQSGGLPRLYSMLAMPQFTETPQDFANEAKFNRRFQTLSAESAGVPINEILEYLKLHPDLSQRNKWWLYTQLHGRFAEPWSSLVVVLIAIPFGAASGRRNIFVGVAGSIVIVFGYFILFRLGLAMGTGGLAPAWAAAWLPNAVFAIAGLALTLRVR